MGLLTASPQQDSICITAHKGRKLNSDRIGRNLWAFPRKRPVGVTRLSRLSELEAGGDAILEALDLPPAVSNHLMYMGFVPDARVRMLRRAPAGDPTVYAVDGIEVALRQETARAIRVRPAGGILDLSQQVDRSEDDAPAMQQAAGAD